MILNWSETRLFGKFLLRYEKMNDNKRFSHLLRPAHNAHTPQSLYKWAHAVRYENVVNTRPLFDTSGYSGHEHNVHVGQGRR